MFDTPACRSIFLLKLGVSSFCNAWGYFLEIRMLRSVACGECSPWLECLMRQLNTCTNDVEHWSGMLRAARIYTNTVTLRKGLNSEDLRSMIHKDVHFLT